MTSVTSRPIKDGHQYNVLTNCPKCEAKTDHMYKETIEIPVEPRDYTNCTIMIKRLRDNYSCSKCGSAHYFDIREDCETVPKK